MDRDGILYVKDCNVLDFDGKKKEIFFFLTGNLNYNQLYKSCIWNFEFAFLSQFIFFFIWGICKQTFDAYVIGKEDAPGIVVLQEWWGVDYEIKNHAQKISQFEPGYKALIPE